MKKILAFSANLMVLVLAACSGTSTTTDPTTAYTTPTTDGSIYSAPSTNPTQAPQTQITACTSSATVSTTNTANTVAGCGNLDYNKLFQAAYASYGYIAVQCIQPLSTQLSAIPQGATSAVYLAAYNQVVAQLSTCFQNAAARDAAQWQWRSAIQNLYYRLAYAMSAVCQATGSQNCRTF